MRMISQRNSGRVATRRPDTAVSSVSSVGCGSLNRTPHSRRESVSSAPAADRLDSSPSGLLIPELGPALSVADDPPLSVVPARLNDQPDTPNCANSVRSQRDYLAENSTSANQSARAEKANKSKSESRREEQETHIPTRCLQMRRCQESHPQRLLHRPVNCWRRDYMLRQMSPLRRIADRLLLYRLQRLTPQCQIRAPKWGGCRSNADWLGGIR